MTFNTGWCEVCKAPFGVDPNGQMGSWFHCEECHLKKMELKKKNEFNSISKPAHYVEGRKFEPRLVIRDWGLNFNLGCVVKYLSRQGRKDPVLQELKKAKQFLEFEIEAIEEEMSTEKREV